MAVIILSHFYNMLKPAGMQFKQNKKCSTGAKVNMIKNQTWKYMLIFTTFKFGLFLAAFVSSVFESHKLTYIQQND